MDACSCLDVDLLYHVGKICPSLVINQRLRVSHRLDTGT